MSRLGFSPVSNLHRDVRVNCCRLCVGNCIAWSSSIVDIVVVVVVVVVCVYEAAHEAGWLRWGTIHPDDEDK